MEVELRTYLQVWFGSREPDWEEYDDEEWEDKLILQKNSRKKAIHIMRKAKNLPVF
jgi:hypothetical protein